MNELIERKERFEGIAQSTEEFPVDFNDAWQWVGYSTKQKGLNMLTTNFEEGIDFLTARLKSTGGRPAEGYYLAVDCFKSFCMMAGTEKGKEVRKYYIRIEKAWNTPEAVMARVRQMGAIPNRKEPSVTRIREFRIACEKGYMTVNEYRGKALNLPPFEVDAPLERPGKGKAQGPRPPDIPAVRSDELFKFVDEYLELTENLDDYIKANDLYNRYVKQSEDPLSRWTFVHTMKGSFSLTYKQKKINGYPTLAFMGCKFKVGEDGV
jgi:phage anti-repressor protein